MLLRACAATAAAAAARRCCSTGLLLQQQWASSAAESAAAVHRAEAKVLQRAGLSPAAAAAVQQAWHSGAIKPVGGTPKSPLQHGPADKPLASGRRLLGYISRVFRAHSQAAAGVVAAPSGRRRRTATAAAEAAAADGAGAAGATTAAAVTTRRRRAAAAGAAAGASGAAAGQGSVALPDWGALDMQRIISQDPALLTLPVAELSSRLTALLHAVAALLGPEPAVQFVNRHPKLRLLLADTATTLGKLRQQAEAYTAVVGVPPRPALLTATDSTHTRLSVQLFRRKLEHLVDRWGREATHGALTSQPHLLASSITSLGSNADKMQGLLGFSDADMARLVKRAPRVLNTNPQRVVTHLNELSSLLLRAGLAANDVRQVVRKLPALLVYNPVTTTAKLEGLESLLGLSVHRLRRCIVQHPRLLLYSAQSLADKVDGMQQLLGCSRDAVCAMLADVPSAFSFDLDTLAGKLQQLTQVLGIPLPEAKALVRRSVVLLTLRPELVASKLALWSQALRVDRAEVASVIVSYPELAAFDGEAVVAHMQLLQSLVSRSPQWLARFGPGGGGQAPQPGTGAAEADDASPAAATGSQSLRRRRRQSLPLLQHQQEEEPQALVEVQQSPRVRHTWPLALSRTISTRLLLRLEYLLATGLHETVTVSTAFAMSDARWQADFPDFTGWVPLRLQHLQQDPCDWPPLLVDKAAKWVASAANRKAAVASGRTGRPTRQRKLRGASAAAPPSGSKASGSGSSRRA